MRVDLDAKVRTGDGEDAGTVQRVVVDPHSNEVTDFVVSTGGLLGHDVLVPREEIERAAQDGDTIRLRLSKAELERLPIYAPAAYAAPAAGWVPPAGYGFPYGSFLWPMGIGADMAPAMTAPGAYAGAGSAADAGIVAGNTAGGTGGAGAAGDGTGLPEISKGAVVLDQHGEDVGAVDDVRLDAATGQLRGFVLRVGGTLRTMFGGGDTLEVGASEVDRVEAELVRLRVSKEWLEAQQHVAR
jgi:sporulation protein YlmC with PRC-barrel domain